MQIANQPIARPQRGAIYACRQGDGKVSIGMGEASGRQVGGGKSHVGVRGSEVRSRLEAAGQQQELK